MNIVEPDVKIGMCKSDVINTLSSHYKGLQTNNERIPINAAGVVLVFTLNFLTSIEKM